MASFFPHKTGHFTNDVAVLLTHALKMSKEKRISSLAPSKLDSEQNDGDVVVESANTAGFPF